MIQIKIAEALSTKLDHDLSWEVKKTAAITLQKLLSKLDPESRDKVVQALGRFEREYEIYEQELRIDNSGC